MAYEESTQNALQGFLREAEEAIRKRMEVADCYGDQTVREKIEDALREIRG